MTDEEQPQDAEDQNPGLLRREPTSASVAVLSLNSYQCPDCKEYALMRIDTRVPDRFPRYGYRFGYDRFKTKQLGQKCWWCGYKVPGMKYTRDLPW